jgi:UDP-N-acetylmuramyl pentapeptide phosphotransferase/UDP-N-acetylglucosamine-1-phosphate transferase
MLSFQIQLPQLVAFAVANFLLGWLWYSPIAPWFKAWAKAAGLPTDPKKLSKKEKERMPVLFGGAIISSFAISAVLQILVRSLNAQSFGQGACIGALAWAGFVVPVLLGTLWEGRKEALLAINAGNYLFLGIVFGGVLAVWR